ncbi:hypothetical protein MAR_020001 [Mya arenaria]|uniref:P/Homo B domain-containing protein n=1 Tax=Mya arenaria TaxID=6604 RepID=A0ABY7E780_MYAAR|nr:hypothetical protein MAR_020001 [Mya arenaria]
MSVKCEENVLNKKGKYDMGTILCLVVLLNTPCASCLSRFILEVAKQDIGDVKQRLVNIGLVYVFKVTDEFYVFESNDGAKLADTIKHAAKGKVKNIYEDTSMFPEAGEDAGTAAGDDDRWGMPKSNVVHNVFGFGYVQTLKMVHLAKTWKPLLPLLTQSRISFDVTQSGNDSSPEVISTFNNICTNQPHCIENIEKVVVHINFVYPKHTRSILSVISPCGTESILLDHIGEPPEDESDFGKNEGVNIDASFLSNHFWGENMSYVPFIKQN